MELSESQKKKLLSAAEIVEHGDLAVLTKILEFQDFLEKYQEDKEQMETVLSKMEEIAKLCDASDSEIVSHFSKSLASLETALKSQITASQGTSAEQFSAFKSSVASQLESIKASIPNMPDLSFYADRLVEIESRIPEIKDTIIETPVETRDKLETLKGDERLDKTAIKGLDKMIEQEYLDRAIGILDQRSSYLVQKVSNLQETVNQTVSAEFWTRTGNDLYPTTITDMVGFGTASPNAQIESLSITEQLRLSYDPTHYTSLTVNSSGNASIAPSGGTLFIGSGMTLTTGGDFFGANLYNYTSSSNARIALSTTGTNIIRNIADANPALTISQLHASSTGNILTLTNSVGTVASVSQAGIISGVALAVTTGITQTGANFNLYIPSGFNAFSAGAVYNFAGSTTQYLRTGFYGNGSTSMTTGANFGAVVFASTPISTFTSGTHSWIANAVIKAPGTITNNGATVTNTASLYLDGAGTGGTNNYLVYSSVFNIDSVGNTLIAGTLNAVSGGVTGNWTSNAISSSSTNANLYVPAPNGAVGTAVAQYQYAGSTTNVMKGGIFGSTSSSIANGRNYSSFQFGQAVATFGAGVTAPWASQVVINTPTYTLTGGGVVTSTAQLYITAPSTAGINNYAIYSESGNINLANGSLTLATAGNKLNIATGTNASIGTATLVGGTVTVNTTAVTASSKIFLTDATTGALTNIGTPTVGTIVAGTSFVINSTNILDASAVNWLIIN